MRLRLAGLSAAEISEFVDHAVEGDLGPQLPELARVLRELTGGNAFLITELWRTLLETETLSVHDGNVRLARAAAELGSPEGVREVVSQRLARLSTATTTLLELAAVAGPEFDLTVINQSGLRV